MFRFLFHACKYHACSGHRYTHIHTYIHTYTKKKSWCNDESQKINVTENTRWQTASCDRNHWWQFIRWKVCVIPVCVVSNAAMFRMKRNHSMLATSVLIPHSDKSTLISKQARRKVPLCTNKNNPLWFTSRHLTTLSVVYCCFLKRYTNERSKFLKLSTQF